MIKNEADALNWLHGLPDFNTIAQDRLERLIALLVEENSRQNLVSSASLCEVWRRHIVDSAQLLSHVPRETSGTWMDLGTGAGFPGLVVAMLRPEMSVRMIESRSRRSEWLKRSCDQLSLQNATVVASRLEMVETEVVSVISARAFAPLDKLLHLSARFSTKSTLWLLPKGRSAGQELAELSGWDHMFHVEPSITDPEAGIIVGHLDPMHNGQGLPPRHSV